MKLSEDNKKIIEILKLHSGVNFDDVKKVLEALVTLFIMNYEQEKDTHIPFIGNFKIVYKGDNIVRGGKEAIIEMLYSPDSLLLRLIGQIVDKDETDIEKDFIQKIKNELDKKAKEK